MQPASLPQAIMTVALACPEMSTNLVLARGTNQRAE